MNRLPDNRRFRTALRTLTRRLGGGLFTLVRIVAAIGMAYVAGSWFAEGNAYNGIVSALLAFLLAFGPVNS